MFSGNFHRLTLFAAAAVLLAFSACKDDPHFSPLAPGEPWGDADLEENEADSPPADCNGECSGGEDFYCLNGDLCVCEGARWRLESCDMLCIERGYSRSGECLTDESAKGSICLCRDDETSCEADFTIESLPFVHTGDTSDAADDFNPSGNCFAWSLDGYDHVFAIDMAKGESIAIELVPVPESGYDPALVVAESCSSLALCIAASDSAFANESELLTFTAGESAAFYIVVDSGYAAGEEASSGGYTLNVAAETPPDGDVSEEESD